MKEDAFETTRLLLPMSDENFPNIPPNRSKCVWFKRKLEKLVQVGFECQRAKTMECVQKI